MKRKRWLRGISSPNLVSIALAVDVAGALCATMGFARFRARFATPSQDALDIGKKDLGEELPGGHRLNVAETLLFSIGQLDERRAVISCASHRSWRRRRSRSPWWQTASGRPMP